MHAATLGGRSSSIVSMGSGARDREPLDAATTAATRSFYVDARSDLERTGSLYAERDRGYLSDMSSR